MPPNRKTGRDLPPNLYPNPRNGVMYYRYRDPRNGRFHGMGSDKDSAVADAKALNAAIYASISRDSVIEAIKPDTPRLSAAHAAE